MALIDDTRKLTSYISENKQYTNYNYELFDIYEGNLKPYVEKILRDSLSENYFSQIKHRIYPINILKRIIDKISKSYSHKPTREASSDQNILEFYETAYMFDQKMNFADEFANLFKGYALEPYIQNGIPSLRVLPFDRFLVQSGNIIDPTVMTLFYKYLGKIPKNKNGQTVSVDLWFVYSPTEFVAIDEDGDIVPDYMVDGDGNPLSGENPLGFIPFYYGNRSYYKILPTQDTDTLALAKLLPVQISDLAGTILFQCFSIFYGVDVDSENMIMSPNAFWGLKSDPQSGHAPQVGTITPSADVNKVLDFIKDVFSTWMESRGIRVGAMSRTQGDFNMSGISKVIDEMDTYETVKKQIEFFKKDEYNFWQLQKNMHNYWLESGELKGMSRLPDSWEVITEFDEPKPVVSRNDEIDYTIKEREGGIISQETAIKKLYPDWKDKEVKEEINKINSEQFGDIGGTDGMAEV
jgi:hypothetical protein